MSESEEVGISSGSWVSTHIYTEGTVPGVNGGQPEGAISPARVGCQWSWATNIHTPAALVFLIPPPQMSNTHTQDPKNRPDGAHSFQAAIGTKPGQMVPEGPAANNLQPAVNLALQCSAAWPTSQLLFSPTSPFCLDLDAGGMGVFVVPVTFGASKSESWAFKSRACLSLALFPQGGKSTASGQALSFDSLWSSVPHLAPSR